MIKLLGPTHRIFRDMATTVGIFAPDHCSNRIASHLTLPPPATLSQCILDTPCCLTESWLPLSPLPANSFPLLVMNDYSLQDSVQALLLLEATSRCPPLAALLQPSMYAWCLSLPPHLHAELRDVCVFLHYWMMCLFCLSPRFWSTARLKTFGWLNGLFEWPIRSGIQVVFYHGR